MVVDGDMEVIEPAARLGVSIALLTLSAEDLPPTALGGHARAISRQREELPRVLSFAADDLAAGSITDGSDGETVTGEYSKHRRGHEGRRPGDPMRCASALPTGLDDPVLDFFVRSVQTAPRATRAVLKPSDPCSR